MRAFVALDPPEAAREALSRLQAGLGVGRPVPEENLHLTLAFLGEISEAEARALAEGLEALARSAPAPEVELRGLDLFGGRRPSVLFVGAGGAGLAPLQGRVARAARMAGIDLARRRFRPHVTIARFPRDLGPTAQNRLAEFLALEGRFALPPAPWGELTLYRSHLREAGAIHEPLAQFDLLR
ncbi:MAG: RNA 2',3'-cyclic phosphodiesterase [Alphaproteobacteria bacterium]|nr:MAG: RNA 2',3'-cyclic phosphodiesterase [Alphaproteobacteria bacterium]